LDFQYTLGSFGKTCPQKVSETHSEDYNTNNTENLPVVLIGDLNSHPDSKAIKVLMRYFGDPLNQTQRIGDESTFNDFGRRDTTERIDYIIFKGWMLKSYHHLSNEWKDSSFLSDQKAVFAEVSF
jgi:endonuclease/exonuclease/phosphatase family metal-dependent hydrolase